MQSTMLNFEQVGPNALSIAAVAQDARGNKRAAITLDGKPATFRLPKMRCPFGASVWDSTTESTRKNLCFTTTPQVEDYCQQLDTVMLDHVAGRSKEFFWADALQGGAVRFVYSAVAPK